MGEALSLGKWRRIGHAFSEPEPPQARALIGNLWGRAKAEKPETEIPVGQVS